MEGYCRSVVSSEFLDPLGSEIVEKQEVLELTLDSDLIFSIPKIISFCSQGTTLKAGTIILTGTPAGVGHSYAPKEYLRDGDEFSVEILPYIGTLTTKFVKKL